MSVREIATQAKRAGIRLAGLDANTRASLLRAAAAALDDAGNRRRILDANAKDLSAAEQAVGSGDMEPALLKRLSLTAAKLDGLADGLRQLAEQHELVGAVSLRRQLDDGLVLERVACPLGLVGVVFESRPDAVPQISGLALKSGNAVLLKGGSEARESNRALVEVLRNVLEAHEIDPAAIGLLEERAQVHEMLKLDELIDVVVARGSNKFVRGIMNGTSIPVMGHSEGLCHLYLHRLADPEMAAKIAVDSKAGYPAACNAIETLVWDDGAEVALAKTIEALQTANVKLLGDEATRKLHPGMEPASDEDWDAEYGALTLAIRHTADLDGALAHIDAHGSRHTECIVTSDPDAAARFLAEVDAAGVFHNASTRFADGYRYGLGAEVGISTGKLHPRGPVGVDGLLTYRWLVRGHGQVASEYGPGKRAFAHRDLETD